MLERLKEVGRQLLSGKADPQPAHGPFGVDQNQHRQNRTTKVQLQIALYGAAGYSALMSAMALAWTLGAGAIAALLGLILQTFTAILLGNLARWQGLRQVVVALAASVGMLISMVTGIVFIYEKSGFKAYVATTMASAHTQSVEVAQLLENRVREEVLTIQSDLAAATKRVEIEVGTGEWGTRLTGCGPVCRELSAARADVEVQLARRKDHLDRVTQAVTTLAAMVPPTTKSAAPNPRDALMLLDNGLALSVLETGNEELQHNASAYLNRLYSELNRLRPFIGDTAFDAILAKAEFRPEQRPKLRSPTDQVLVELSSIASMSKPSDGFSASVWGIMPDVITILAAICLYLLETRSKSRDNVGRLIELLLAPKVFIERVKMRHAAHRDIAQNEEVLDRGLHEFLFRNEDKPLVARLVHALSLIKITHNWDFRHSHGEFIKVYCPSRKSTSIDDDHQLKPLAVALEQIGYLKALPVQGKSNNKKTNYKLAGTAKFRNHVDELLMAIINHPQQDGLVREIFLVLRAAPDEYGTELPPDTNLPPSPPSGSTGMPPGGVSRRAASGGASDNIVEFPG